jgi:hypothetical protein
MNKIFLFLFLLVLTIFPERTFALIYDNKTNKGLSVGEKSDAGYTNEQGHFGINNSDFENCKKLNANYSGLKQGKKIHYDKSNKLIAIENGIFDCAYNINNQHTFYLQEGLIEYHDRDSIVLHYRTDGDKQYIYEKTNGVWFSYTKPRNYPAPGPINSKQATTVEIKNAEKLFIFYKNLDFSSRSAKIYGDKIFNTETSNISNVSKTSASSVKQSKLPNCVGSFNQKTWTNCYGIYKWSNSGDRYEGEYLNGDRHGFGTYFYANGNKYSGEYKNDRPNGRGTITFSSGDKYIGEVKNGKRHGAGTYFFSDGERLTGRWNENEYVDAKNYRKVENENSNFTKKTKSTESARLKTSSSIKEYWWVLILLIGVIFFVYTQTKKDLNLNLERSFKPRARESKNFIMSFFNGQESLGFSFWIMYSLLTLINFFLFSILDDYSSKQNLNSLVPGIFAWIVVGCYVFSSIGTWRSATNYKLQKIRIRETFGWANVIYVVIVATSILFGIGFIQGMLEGI